MSHPARTYTDSALFGRPIPADLDPAILLNDLRALRPLVEQLRALEPIIMALRDLALTAPQIQELGRAVADHRAQFARLDQAAANIHRIEEIVQLLDQLDVIVRHQ